MNVDDFGDRAVSQFGVCSQTEEKQVVIQIGHFPQFMVDVVDVLEMQMHLHAEDSCPLIRRMPLKARQSW